MKSAVASHLTSPAVSLARSLAMASPRGAAEKCGAGSAPVAWALSPARAVTVPPSRPARMSSSDSSAPRMLRSVKWAPRACTIRDSGWLARAAPSYALVWTRRADDHERSSALSVLFLYISTSSLSQIARIAHPAIPLTFSSIRLIVASSTPTESASAFRERPRLIRSRRIRLPLLSASGNGL